VLHIEPGLVGAKPSNRQMALYYANEVKYLATVKKNLNYADMSYKLFEKYNPGLPMSLIGMGDAFYELGTPAATARGVDEWIKAYAIPGESRTAASARLSKHYIADGERLFKRAQTPEGQDTDLPDALNAFTLALQYDLNNSIAANHVTETTKAIGERADRYDAQQKYLQRVDGFTKKAERSAVEKDFGAALTSYRQALNVLPLIEPEFKDLYKQARDKAGEISQAVKQVIADVYASANDSIEKGDTALLNGNVDDAVRAYQAVQSIVAVVPAEEGSLNAQKKKDMATVAQTKIDEAEVQRKRLAQQKSAPGASPAGAPKKP
jgi:tetratricopeptide (TPR) repeat protein